MAITNNVNIRWTGTQTRDIKESVLDAVIDTAPMQTPFLSMIRRGPAPDNIVHEWLTDYSGAYPTSVGDVNYRGEGDDANPSASDSRTMMFNRTSIIGRDWSVSHTQEVVAKHGVVSEFDYQAARNSRKLARELNFDLLNGVLDVDSNGPNTGTTANKRKMGGLIDITNDTSAGSGTYVASGHTLAAGASGYSVASANTSDTTAADITGAQRTIWSRGGVLNGVQHVLVNGTEKEVISNLFATNTGSDSIYRRYFGDAEMTIVLPVDLIVTDFGELHLHLDQAVTDQGTYAGQAIAFDWEMVEINVLRDFEVMELAKTGPSKHGLVEVEATLSVLAPNCCWHLTNIG